MPQKKKNGQVPNLNFRRTEFNTVSICALLLDLVSALNWQINMKLFSHSEIYLANLTSSHVPCSDYYVKPCSYGLWL